MIKTAETGEITAVSQAGSRFRVELSCRSVKVREALLAGLRTLGYERLAPNDERSEPDAARVTLIEEGSAPPEDVPFIVIALTGSEEGFSSAIDSGASGYFVLPLEFLSLGAALCAAVTRRLDRSDRQTVSTVVGILMERFHTERVDAYARLRRYSRVQRRKLVDVAAEIFESTEKVSAALRSIESVSLD